MSELTAQEEAVKIAQAREQFEEDVEKLFPAFQDHLHGVIENYIQQAIDEGDRSFKAKMMVAHQATAMLLGRLEAVALDRGIPIKAVKQISSDCIEKGRGAPIVKRKDDG